MKENMMNRMMDNMSSEEKQEMMDSMMGKFFDGVSEEEKSSMMKGMMGKMMGSSGMGSMMSMMMGKGDDKGESPMNMCRKMMEGINQAQVQASLRLLSYEGFSRNGLFSWKKNCMNFIKEKRK
ncbi:MAG: hypothetical protein PF447_09865 [Spirochaetaceae bacterium]|nr:hypothetical protein [Spirochaetaceae bacterium]